MPELMMISIIFGLVGAQLILLGAFIFKGNVWILAGYDPNKVTDKECLAKWVGSHVIFGGLFTFFYAILVFILQIPLIGLYFIGLAIIVARTILGTKKYEG